MAGADDESEKEHEASQQKLDDARKKGDVPRSTDIGAAAAYAGFLLGFSVLGSWFIQNTGSAMQNMIGKAPEVSQLLFRNSSQPLSGQLLWPIGGGLLTLLFLPAILVVVAYIAQRGLVFAPQKLAPKLSRVSVLANAKNKFGRNGLFEFSKNFVKLLAYSVLVWVFLVSHTDAILSSVHLDPGGIASVLAGLSIDFLAIVFLISAVIGSVDFFWQRHEHLRKNKMSRKEVQDEHKTQEGDPHFKQQRRSRGQAIAMNQMLADVAGADVVIVNPEHYAVALKWDRGGGNAPVCVAKGVDDIALRIRNKAAEAGIPVQRDPPAARALFATVRIGDEILPEQYKAVAAAIRFADEVRSKARSAFN